MTEHKQTLLLQLPLEDLNIPAQKQNPLPSSSSLQEDEHIVTPEKSKAVPHVDDNNRTNDANDDEEEDHASLHLMKLPPNLTLEELTGANCAYFVGPSSHEHGDEESDEDEEASSSVRGGGNNRQQACFVIETIEEGGAHAAGKTFALSHVETSNSLILIPPDKKHAPDEGDPRCSKRRRCDEDNATIDKSPPEPQVARMIHPNPTTFLELTQRQLDPGDVRNALQRAQTRRRRQRQGFPGHAKQIDRPGVAPSVLARKLRCSQSEVLHALQTLHAFALPSWPQTTTNNHTNEKTQEEVRYTFLPEELQQEVVLALFSAIAESLHWSPEAVPVEECVTLVQTMVSTPDDNEEEEEEEALLYPMEQVILHCLTMLCQSNPAFSNNLPSKVQLDPKKVGLFLAHRLLASKKNKPWPEAKFMTEWNRLMPGVGKTWEAMEDWLKGVALREVRSCKGSHPGATPDPTASEEKPQEEETEVAVLHYFPEGILSRDPSLRFRALFDKKAKWTKEEITPYVEPLVKGSGTTMGELLLVHCRTVVEEEGGQKCLIRRS